MKRNTKIWFLIAVSLIVVGCITACGIMFMLHWNFNKLSTVKYTTNTHSISEEFQNISIQVDTADITILPSENDDCRIVCYEEAKYSHYITVQNNTLSIKKDNNRKWYDYFAINIGNPKITIYLPDREYGDLSQTASTANTTIAKDFTFRNISINVTTGAVNSYASALKAIKIKASTGDITIENIAAKSIDISVTTGRISAKSVKCDGEFTTKVSTGGSKIINTECLAFTSTGSTGDLYLKNLIATDRITVKRDTGDIKFEQCDASEITLKTTTGDVEGSLRSEKVFIINTDTGEIDVPKTTTGGKCEITTDTGDIEIEIEK